MVRLKRTIPSLIAPLSGPMAGGWECDSEFDAMGFLSATSDTPNTAATWISGFCQTNLSPIFRSHLG